MIIAHIDKVFDAAIDLPWSKDFRFWRGLTKGDPLNIVGFSAVIVPRACGADPVITITVANGLAVVAGNVGAIRLEPADLAVAGPGEFDITVTATLADGSGRRMTAPFNIADVP